MRTYLTAPATYYVNELTGSDSNAGTAAAPWRTLTRAYNWCRDNLDLGGQKVTIQVTSPTLSVPMVCDGPLVGQVQPEDFLVTGTGYLVCFTASFPGAVLFLVKNSARIGITAMTLSATGAGGMGVVVGDGVANVFNLSFGSFGNAALDAAGPRSQINGSQYLVWQGPASATAGATAEDHALITLSCNLYIAGDYSFGGAFVQGDLGGMIDASNANVTPGGASGRRFNAVLGGIVFTGGTGNPNFFPGSAPGVAAGGYYN